ncbi:MAG: 4Fe-4S dicluster domain-containing protein [Acidobacteria bacterium]|nr:4Fe-4S dicluster domain-containing protein [Acidobacteriota bacterium]
MATRVNPSLHDELKGFGAKDLDLCYNCGNCTAVCSLAEEGSAFPRRIMHVIQVGAEERLRHSVDPWLCYYCGDCSAQCPRGANPGEAMMAARRYLTSRYDWTGLSRRIYLSKAWDLAAVLFVALFVVALFAFFHGPMVLDHVELNTFAPVRWVELGDLVMAGILSFFLLTNAARMSFWILREEGAPPLRLSAFFSAIPEFIVNFATQKRWRRCGVQQGKAKENSRWLTHLILVSGYLTMLTLIVVFLRWFQTDVVYPFYHPQRLLGYYATAALLYGTVAFMAGRWKKRDEIHKFSEATDWMFLILLFLTTLTGLMVNLFRLAEWPMATYMIYVIHLAVAVPMLVVEVPFGKWSHLFYRPLALYLVKVREISQQAEEAGAQTAPAAA